MKKLILGTALVAVSSMANAELIATDWKIEGDASATLDTITGLEWLDLTITDGMSIAEVEDLLDTTYSGFRLATESEVKTLIADYTGVTVNQAVKVLDDEVIDMWQGFFGVTGPEGRSMGRYMIGNSSYMAGTRNSGTVYSQYYRGSENNSNGYDGVFLVSEGGATLSSIQNPDLNIAQGRGPSVPLPATLGMLLLPLALLRRTNK